MTNDILVGDRFYYNYPLVRKGAMLPDYMIVILSKNDYVVAQYENHGVGIRERAFSKVNLFADSNLNEGQENPEWIFVKKLE